MATPTTKTPTLTALGPNEGRKLTYYVHNGVKYATPSNWKLQGLAPKAGAIATTKTTSQGYEFAVYAESEVTVYDAEAETRKREAIKELNRQASDAQKAFMAHEVDEATFVARSAEIAQALATLMSA